MVYRVAVATTILVTALGSFGTAVAAADSGPTVCDFTLSAPQVVNISGTSMVLATLIPATCNGSAKPTSTQVCLSTPGSTGRCAELPGYASAHAYLSPYVPGQTYTARGRGCSITAFPPQSICSTQGPVSVVL